MNTGYHKAKMLVELSAVAAYHGSAFLSSGMTMSRAGIESYWLASRNRLDGWAFEMKRLETLVADQAASGVHALDEKDWLATAALNEEIMVSEILTRIWTTLGTELDLRTDTSESGPFVRSVFNAHLDARHRMMRLLFEKMNLTPVQARKADKVRRHSERWTDVLLGFLDSTCNTQEFAFEAGRVQDFATSLCGHHAPGMAQSLLMVSLRSTFQVGFLDRCPNPGYNEQIAASVLGCFGPDIFDSIGLFKTLWQTRMENTARDTQGMLDCLIAEHQPQRGSTLPRPDSHR